MVLKQLQNYAGAAILGSSETDPAKPVGKLESTEASCCKPKKGSVFPVKRRLVKTMMFNSIVKFIASVFSSPERIPIPIISLSPPKTPNAKKCNHTQIFPYPNPDRDDSFAMHRRLFMMFPFHHPLFRSRPHLNSKPAGNEKALGRLESSLVSTTSESSPSCASGVSIPAEVDK
ncbi:hypothetical protein ACLB2K_010265 [Fragaria x ananassa]